MNQVSEIYMNDVLDEVEVACLLACDQKTVQEKARSGVLPAVKFGRSWRFPRTALQAAALLMNHRIKIMPLTLPQIQMRPILKLP